VRLNSNQRESVWRLAHFHKLQIVEPGRARDWAPAGGHHVNASQPPGRRLEPNGHSCPFGVSLIITRRGEDFVSAAAAHGESPPASRAAGNKPARPHPAAETVPLPRFESNVLITAGIARRGGGHAQRLAPLSHHLGVEVEARTCTESI